MTTEVAVIGSVLVVLLLAVLVVYVTTIYRQSRALTKAALAGPVSEPVEVTCGIRYRSLNATWPEGHLRIDDSGVEFSGAGTSIAATWPDVSVIRLVRPFTLMGFGLIYSLINPTRTVTIWLTSHELATRVLEASRYHGASVNTGWSLTV